MVPFFSFENFCLYLLTLTPPPNQPTRKKTKEKGKKKNLVLPHGNFDADNQCKSIREENSEGISFI